MGLGLVVEDEVAGGVRDLGIGPGLGEDAGIVEGAVGLRHLQDAYAVRELAQGEGGIVVVVSHKARDAELVREEVRGGIKPELVEHLGGDGVDGKAHGRGDVHVAAIFPVGVLGVPLVLRHLDLLPRRVVDERGGGDESELNGRGVDRQGLE